MNVSISLLIIFGTVFLVGEHVLARTLETGRAGGYYTHSGKGDRSARARFELFKSRKTPTTRTSITPISVSDQYGNRYRGDLITSTYDPSAKARAGAAAWDKRQSAKAKTIINQAEHEAQSKIAREEEAQVFRASLSRLQEAVKQGRVDKVLADKMVKVLSLRVKQGIMNRREAAGAIDYLILNNKINIK